jgi:membrane protein implicated in regulation of membrane protease activity
MIVLDFVTAQIFCVWFALAGVSAVICSIFCPNPMIQIIVFIVSSIIALIIAKFVSKKIMNFKKEETNIKKIVGRQAEVVVEINNKKGTGQVNISGVIWSAKSSNEKIILPGEQVLIENIKGVKLIVSRIKI